MGHIDHGQRRHLNEKFPQDFQTIFGSAITSTVTVVFLLDLLFNHWTAFTSPHSGVVSTAPEAGAGG
ncbi:MAG: hypothetical protein ACR2MP_28035 [Streptosporangiaceae bacterium]